MRADSLIEMEREQMEREETEKVSVDIRTILEQLGLNFNNWQAAVAAEESE